MDKPKPESSQSQSQSRQETKAGASKTPGILGTTEITMMCGKISVLQGSAQNQAFLARIAEYGIDPAKIKTSSKDYKPRMGKKPKVKAAQAQPHTTKKYIHGTPEYWEYRRRNNEAARNSRELRKAKDNALLIKTIYLEEKFRYLDARYKQLLALKAEKLAARAARVEEIKKDDRKEDVEFIQEVKPEMEPQMQRESVIKFAPGSGAGSADTGRDCDQ